MESDEPLSSQPQLQEYWEQATRRDSTTYQEKGEWLDCFLINFLLELHMSGRPPEEILSFSCTSAVIGVLGQQLLEDVREITEQLAQQPGISSNNPPVLRDYFFRGRGWRILAALKHLRLQRSAYSRKVALLLISLYHVYGEQLGDSESQCDEVPSAAEFAHVASLPTPESIALAVAGTPKSTPSIPRPPQHHPRVRFTSQSVPTSDSDASSVEEMDRHVSRNLLLKANPAPDNFAYFSGIVKSDGEEVEPSQEIATARIPPSLKGAAMEVAQCGLTRPELCSLMTDILMGACSEEATSNSDNTSGGFLGVAPQVVEFASQVAVGHPELMGLLLVGSFALLRHPDCIATLNKTGVVGLMVQAVQKPDEGGMLKGLWAFAGTLLKSRTSWQCPRDLMEILRPVFATPHVTYLMNTWPTMDPNESKSILGWVSHCVQSLKDIRGEALHMLVCHKSRHKRCGWTHLRHHHGQEDASPCAVGRLTQLPLAMAATVQGDVLLAALQTLQQCSLCCCLHPDSVVPQLLDVVRREGASRAVQLSLRVLEKCVYGRGEEEKGCQACADGRTGRRDGVSHLSRQASCEVDSALYTSDSSAAELLDGRHSKWRCVAAYRLLLEDDECPSHGTIMHHLLDVLGACREGLRIEIYSRVIQPLFLTCKKRYLSSLSPTVSTDLDKDSVACCLAAFAFLFGEGWFAAHFSDHGGLAHLVDLVGKAEFSVAVCEVLEAMVGAEAIGKRSAEQENQSSGSSSNGDGGTPVALLLYDLLLRSTDKSQAILQAYLHQEKARQFLDYASQVQVKERMASSGNESGVESTSSAIGSNYESSYDVLLGNDDPPISKLDTVNNNNNSQSEEEALDNSQSSVQHDNADVCSQGKLLEGFASQLEEQMVLLGALWRTSSRMVSFCPPFRTLVQSRGLGPQARQVLCLSLKVLLMHSQSLAPMGLKRSLQDQLLKLCEPLLAVTLMIPESTNDFSEAVNQLMESLALILQGLCPFMGLDVRHLGDVFLKSCVLTQSGQVLIQHRAMPQVPLLMSDVTSDLSSDCNDFSSEEHDPYLTAEDGYDADVEMMELSKDSTLPAALEETDPQSSDSTPPITFPQACSTLVHILVRYNETFYDTMEKRSDENVSSDANGWEGTEEEEHLLALVSNFQRLVVLCKHSHYNCSLLSRERVVEALLEGFPVFFHSSNPRFADIQRCLLELVTLLTRCSITSKELSLYLGFFKEDNPPLTQLLLPLVSLARWWRQQPSQALVFPTSPLPPEEYHHKCNHPRTLSASLPMGWSWDWTDDMAMASSKEGKKGVPWSHGRCSEAVERTSRGMRQKGVPCTWALAALALPLAPNLAWSPRNPQGFSISLWAHALKHEDRKCDLGGASTEGASPNSRRTYPASDSVQTGMGSSASLPISLDDCLHFVSIGCENLMLEVWFHQVLEVFVIRLTRLEAAKVKVLSQTFMDFGTTPIGWHHFAFNCKETTMQKKKATFEMTMIVDGWMETHATLEFPWVSSSKKTSMTQTILLGHTVLDFGNDCSSTSDKSADSPSRPSQTTYSWQLGNVLVFKEHVFNRRRALFLRSYGPDCCNLTHCDAETLMPNFASVASQETTVFLDGNLDREETNLKALQDALLLVYSPGQPEVILYYPHVCISTAGVLSGFLSGGPSFRVVNMDQRSSQHQPLPLPALWLSRCSIRRNGGLPTALSPLGGISVFLFLFARVVEIGVCEENEARALYLLLRLVQSDNELAAQFAALQGHQLIQHVLVSSHHAAGYHHLKAILDCCLHQPLMRFYPGQNKFHLLQHSEALVVDPHLMAAALRDWWAWDKEHESDHDYADVKECEDSVFAALLQGIQILLRDSHPFREFNLLQLNRANFVHLLMLYCKERLLYEERKCGLSRKVATLILDLVHSMLGSPPEILHLASIAQCLLLLHNASRTFVSHVRSSCYYLLATTPGESAHRKPHLGLRKLPSGLIVSTTNSQSNIYDYYSPSDEGPHLNFNGEVDRTDSAKANHAPAPSGEPNEITTSVMLSSPESGWVDLAALIAEKQGMSEPAKNSGDTEKDSASDGRNEEVPSSDTLNCPDTEQLEEHIRQEIKQRHASDKVGEGSPQVKWQLGSHDTSSEIQNDWEVVEDVDMEEAALRLEGEKGKDRSEKETQVASLLLQGFLQILANSVLIAPDNMAPQILSTVISPQFLIVMANNEYAAVRVAVVKAVDAYLQRCSEDEWLAWTHKLQGFRLLANQLHQFPATPELADACISLMLLRPFDLSEEASDLSENDHLSLFTQSPKQMATLPLILTLLAKSVDDLPLCHNLLVFLREFLTKLPLALEPAVNEAALLEALLSTLLAVNHSTPHPLDVCGACDQDVLYDDMHAIIRIIASHSVSGQGQSSFQVFHDMLNLLSYLERRERQQCGWGQKCTTAIREAKCAAFHGALYRIKELAAEIPEMLSRWHRHASFILSDGHLHDRRSLQMPLEAWESTYEENLHANLSMSLNLHDNRHPTEPTKSHSQRDSKSSKGLSRGDLQDRMRMVMQRAVDFVVCAPSATQVEEEERTFVLGLLYQLHQMARMVVTRKGGNRSTKRGQGPGSGWWAGLAWAVRDTIQVQFGRMVLHLMSPNQKLDLRCHLVTSLCDDPNCKELLTFCYTGNSQVEPKFTLYFQELISLSEKGSTQMSRDDARKCMQFRFNLQDWGVLSMPLQPYSIAAGDQETWREELQQVIAQEEKIKKSIVAGRQPGEIKVVFAQESMNRQVAESAMMVTKLVVEAQNCERKAFIGHIKKLFSESVTVRSVWLELVRQLTHEEAVWHFPRSYPKSWSLDPTEGPMRVRVRLQRCHLGISSKYLLPEYQHKLEAEKLLSPLSFLFECHGEGGKVNSSRLVDHLKDNEKITFTSPGNIITPAFEAPGELLVGETCVYFVLDQPMPLSSDSPSPSPTPSSNPGLSSGHGNDLPFQPPVSILWNFDEVREIHNRRFQLRDCALEVYLVSGRTHLIAFSTTVERDCFAMQVCSFPLPNRVVQEDLHEVTQIWREGLMTNLEYLTQLNKMAGRTFNDLMQYPIFPFVLSDYSEHQLDLTNPKSFRHFRRPMAVQKRENEQHYISNYNYLKQEMESGIANKNLNQGPYHYGSHYSNSGSVLHFLVRLPPFTKMFLTYQDRNFDIPDRTFHALQTTWRLTSSDSTTDVKELIPEFFFLPEFLVNSEGFNFGVRQSGERVHHVHLPPWAKRDPRRFVLVHRQALESDFVRENLHHWIDLIFGFKQTGKAAVEAINVFHPATYFGFDVDSIKDPIERRARETMVKTYGQTPRQLFKHPHQMVAQTLTATRHTALPIRPVLEEVKGLSWGSFVGSPADPPPSVVWSRRNKAPVATLVALVTNDIFGLAPGTSIILSYNKDRGSCTVSTTTVTGFALVTWGHPDGVVRVKLHHDKPPHPLIKASPRDPISICQSVPDCKQLWIGHSSGAIHVYRFAFDPSSCQLRLINGGRSSDSPPPSTLLAHRSPVAAIHLCRPFSIAVTAGRNGGVAIWDLNQLSMVRCISSVPGQKLQAVGVSEASADIAVVGGSSGATSQSSLRLYTVNASLVAHRLLEDSRVTAVCFSNAPEGVSVNVLATGFANGSISLWSTWDLTLVRTIQTDTLEKPIICLTYSHDTQHLYASATDGTVVIWEGSGARGTVKAPKLFS